MNTYIFKHTITLNAYVNKKLLIADWKFENKIKLYMLKAITVDDPLPTLTVHWKLEIFITFKSQWTLIFLTTFVNGAFKIL